MDRRGWDWPVRRSTRAFAREGRCLLGYRLRDFLHGYTYARWPFLYIRSATRPETLPRLLWLVHHWATRFFIGARQGTDPARRFADTYHGTVMSTPAAEQLVTLDVAVEIRNLEKVIPYAMARDIVIRGPDRIVALECPCRAARDAPCLPLDVCLIVGEPFASFVADHNPRRARWITQDEAVAILRAERDRGHVHHAFFKDAMLGRFYAICNCCACCCGACAAQCPFGAVTLEARTPRVDVQVCMGCGVCVAQCPTGAVSLVRTPEKGEPLEIRELIGS